MPDRYEQLERDFTEKQMSAGFSVCPNPDCKKPDPKPHAAEGETETEGDHAFQPMICNTCFSTWEDVYKYTYTHRININSKG